MSRRKSRPDFGREPSVVQEEVERRYDKRGPVQGLEVVLSTGESVPVLEAGRKAVFIALDDPDRFALGARIDISVSGRGGVVPARTEVVRKEIAPRRGIALLIVHMSPAAAERYLKMLEV